MIMAVHSFMLFL